ncbi:hypothetical protein [Sorangium sp. So ce131]|uniref:hypothetical protein n=1 Tax=Sorangium sp. So ce131 TaxID=3133282 RepID=UPI003F5EEB44
MIALKFLAAGGVSPFLGYPWPAPGASGPGPWVEAPDDDPTHGVHACRTADLPYWLGEELWRIELDGPVLELPTQLVARRARLIERVGGWTRELALALGAENAWRVRDRAADTLEAEGLLGEAAALRGCADLESLWRDGIALGGARRSHPGKGPLLAELAADAAQNALAGTIASGLYNAVKAAELVHASAGEGVALERRWQARWMAERLGI